MSYKNRTVKVEQTERYWVCDKCGKELEDDGIESVTYPSLGFVRRTIYRNSIIRNICYQTSSCVNGSRSREEVKMYNLCNDCFEQLEVWLKA